MKEYYTIDIAGLKRDLPLCKINDNLYIGAFIMYGDVELTSHCAKELLKLAPEHDIIMTAASKGIPLAAEMARQAGVNEYIVATKSPKLYMKNVIQTEVNSITTEHTQVICIGQTETDLIKGRRVLIVDDVISTGNSLNALERLVALAGGNIVGKMTVLAEGDAIGREDITSLAPLPLFDADGEPIK